MCEGEFEKVKSCIEVESGPLTPADEIETKALFYFAKGVQLKDQLKSKPVHKSRVIKAMADFFSIKKQRAKKH